MMRDKDENFIEMLYEHQEEVMSEEIRSRRHVRIFLAILIALTGAGLKQIMLSDTDFTMISVDLIIFGLMLIGSELYDAYRLKSLGNEQKDANGFPKKAFASFRKSEDYLGENSSSVLLLNTGMDIPQTASVLLTLPSSIREEDQDMILKSPFYKKVKKLLRSKRKYGIEIMQRSVLAVKEIIEMQYQKGNMEFFHSEDPFSIIK